MSSMKLTPIHYDLLSLNTFCQLNSINPHMFLSFVIRWVYYQYWHNEIKSTKLYTVKLMI